MPLCLCPCLSSRYKSAASSQSVPKSRRMKTAVLMLLLLLPLCSAQDFYIECLGFDFLMVQNLVLQCRGPVQQACYTRDTGEKGCTPLRNCVKRGWSCCKTNRCNA